MGLPAWTTRGLAVSLTLTCAWGCSSPAAAPAPDGGMAPAPDASSGAMSDAGSGVPDDGGTSPDAGGALDDAGSAAPDVAVFAACPASPTVGDFPLDVAAVVHDKCQKCHKRPLPNHIPFPLFRYEDTLVPDPIPPYQGLPVWQVMHFVIQPNGVPHMPLGNAPQLTAAEFQTLDTWLSACATPVAEGTGGDVGEDAGMGGSDGGGSDAASE